MRRSIVAVVCSGIFVLVGAAAGCGGSETAEQHDAAVPQQDAAAEDAPSGTASFYVVTGLEVANWAPVAGADVVLDLPGGGREEKQTGSDGRVTFTGLDFSLGKAAVTAYKAGSGMPPTSQVGITADSGEILLYLWALQYNRPTVTISGTAQGLQATTDRLWLTATNASNFSEGVGAAWTFGVWPDVPFTLVAVDYTAQSTSNRAFTRNWISWVTLEHAAVTADTTIDVDLTQSVTRKQASGTMLLPARAESPLRTRGWGHIYVSAWEQGTTASIGAATTSKVSTDGTRIEYTVDWIEPASVAQPVTQYLLTPSSSSSQASFIIRGGYPAGGELDATFVDLPDITNAPDPTAGQDLHGEIAWQVYDPDVWFRCFVNRDGEVAWWVIAPPSETSLRIPQGPTSLDEAALLGSDLLDASCQAFQWDISTDWIERGAASNNFMVARL